MAEALGVFRATAVEMEEANVREIREARARLTEAIETAPAALSPGKHQVEFDFKYDGLGFATLAFNNLSGIGCGGTGTLKVDGKVVSSQRWNVRSRSSCNSMKRSMSALTPARRSTIATTKCHLSLRGSSIS